MAIRSEFQVHMLNERGVEVASAIAEVFSATLDTIDKLVPPGRERSLVVTKLQEAAFWAKRGVAVNPELQKGG